METEEGGGSRDEADDGSSRPGVEVRRTEEVEEERGWWESLDLISGGSHRNSGSGSD